MPTGRNVTLRRHTCGEQGFAMAALLVVLAIMSLMLSMALPVWHHAAQREREAELIFRGEQYARAIMLYQRRTPGAYPPDLETLIEGRFLRRIYSDPMTAEGEFRLLLQSDLAELSGPGAAGGTDDAAEETGDEPGRRRDGARTTGQGIMQGVRPFGDRDERTPGGVDGNIVGVVSLSEETSIALYNGKSKYSEWVFVNEGQSPEATAEPGPAGLPDAFGGPAGRGQGGGMGGLRERLGDGAR